MELSFDAIFGPMLERIKKSVTEQVKAAVDASWPEFFEVLEGRAQEMFDESVSEFYNSYSPEFYGRTGSLYEVMTTIRTDESLTLSFIPSNATVMNNGDTVYGLAFKHGWHGGATAPDGVMRYRTPYPYYKHWGRPAVHSSSPYETLKAKVEGYDTQALFNSIVRKNLGNIKISF